MNYLQAISLVLAVGVLIQPLTVAESRARDWNQIQRQIGIMPLDKVSPEDSAFVRSALDAAISELGPTDTTVAFLKDALAYYCRSVGHLAVAESLYRETADIWKSTAGIMSPQRGEALNALAACYLRDGKLSRSLKAFEETMIIGESAMTSGWQAQVTSNYAAALLDLGRYAESEKMFERAVQLANSSPADDTTFDGQYCQANRAFIYKETGNFTKAEECAREALRIWHERPRNDSAQYAGTLNNLADILIATGNFPQAKEYNQRAREVSESISREAPYAVPMCLLTQSDIAMSEYDYTTALTAADSALSLLKVAYTEKHPDALKAKVRVADCEYHLGDFFSAEKLFLEVVKQRELLLGKNHPDVCDALEKLANTYFAQGKSDSALATSFVACQRRRAHLEANIVVLSERDALLFSKQLKKSVDQFLSFYVQLPAPTIKQRQLVSDVVLAMKGQLAEKMCERQRVLRKMTDSLSVDLLDQWRSVNRDLSELTNSRAANSSNETTSEINRLSIRRDSLEHAALFRIPGMADSRSKTASITSEILRSLSPDKAVVEYYQIERVTESQGIGGDRYLAIVLRAGLTPEVFDLGKVLTIDASVSRFLVTVDNKQGPDLPVSQAQSANNECFAFLWSPLSAAIGKCTHLAISPDGAISVVPFAGLADSTGKFLVETFTITYCLSSRDLVVQEKPSFNGAGLLIMGNADFDADPTTIDTTPTSEYRSPSDGESTGRERSPTECLEWIRARVDPLPSTQQEIRTIDSLWRTQTGATSLLLDSASATEGMFRKLAPSYRFIHVATHGFYFDRECRSLYSDTSASRTILNNPLLLSGIVFAGYNHHSDRATLAGQDDGILTALEVSSMDLSGTELIVLSACQSGNGDVLVGEGVRGLRQAFVTAGIQSQVCALWSVPDDVTARLMSYFYTNGRRSTAESLRIAQLKIIDELRTSHKGASPYFWAAFCAYGNSPVRPKLSGPKAH